MAKKLIRAGRQQVSIPASSGSGAIAQPFAAGTIAAAGLDFTRVQITQTVPPSGGTGPVTVALYRHTSTFTPPGQGTLIANTANFIDTERDPATFYWYEVIYTDANSVVEHSNEVFTHTTFPDTLVAGTIAAAANGTTEVVITQTAAPSGGYGAITLALYRHTSTFTPPGTGTLISTSLPYTDTERSPNTTYYYEAIYTDTLSSTANSNEVNATTADEPGGFDPNAFLDITFDDYADTAALAADKGPGGTFVDDDNFNTGACSGSPVASFELADAAATPASLKTLASCSKSMQYNVNHGSDGCCTVTLTRTVQFDQHPNGPPLGDGLRRVWIEVFHQFSTDWSNTNDGCSPNDLKWFFIDTLAPENGRWAFYIGADSGPSHTYMVETPQRNSGSAFNEDWPFTGGYYPTAGAQPAALGVAATPAGMFASGKAWRHRFYVDCGLANDDAEFRWAISDGDAINVLVHSESGFGIVHNDGVSVDKVSGFSFNHNKDDGPADVQMEEWWGRIRVYTTNPGWSWP